MRLRCASTFHANPRVLRGAAAAAAAGGATVVATAAVALCEPAPTVPKFVLGGNRYDQSTFQGRLTHIQELIEYVPSRESTCHPSNALTLSSPFPPSLVM